MDPHASNFDWNAEVDNGSCEYIGCTDPDAVNYDPDAREDDGSCKYYGSVKFFSNREELKQFAYFIDVEVSGNYIGKIKEYCEIPDPDCNSMCNHVLQLNLTEGRYAYRYWLIQQTGQSAYDTIFASTDLVFFAYWDGCTTVLID